MATKNSSEVIVALFVIFVFLIILLYVLARWRDNREKTPDPQLGYKLVFNFFQAISIQIFLGSISFILLDVFTKIVKGISPVSTHMTKVLVGWLIITAIVYAVCEYFLKSTNQREYPGVTRLINGLNWVICCAVLFVALVTLGQVIVSAPGSKALVNVAPVLLVYLPACIAFGYIVKKSSVPAGESES